MEVNQKEFLDNVKENLGKFSIELVELNQALNDMYEKVINISERLERLETEKKNLK